MEIQTETASNCDSEIYCACIHKGTQKIWSDLISRYSKTSNKGHSERGQTSQQRTRHLYSSIHTLYKITSERGQPLYKGQTGVSQWCPLFGGSTV